ncbi:DMT family transporter [Neptunomonas antarctica]|uniref:Permease of the drug/metabolite transporter (DMT) superfamily n=1 Tax=Neptunomonas antarctica TaxID=619304 RepID=A0A1N7PPA3_9GAMM|nr:DMT family transporter [Neptunomonas antarctica]SIT12219.1 Permease of the drug/metabolite transporter (DMT) superfamily [Neptunomonas antarctica]
MVALRTKLIPFIPFIFVMLWSTGFIGAKYGLPYIEPFNMLFIRMLMTLCVFMLLMLALKSRWPTGRQGFHQMVSGSLVHAAYLGGVFAAIKWDMPAGIAAIVVGLQPLLTALIGRVWFKQSLAKLQLLGLVLGLVGVSLVLTGGKELSALSLRPEAIAAVIVALLGISIGTLYQKRFGAGVDLMAGSFFQYMATALWMGLLTFSTETRDIDWSLDLMLALGWLVFGLSVSAVLLLMYMIREGESARVASYFYLVPPVTVIEAWWLFDEALGVIALIGIFITVLGVYLVLKSPKNLVKTQ